MYSISVKNNEMIASPVQKI